MIMLLKVLLAMYLMGLVMGCLSAIWRFFFDVSKWHDYEKKYKKDGLAAVSAIVDDINNHYSLYDVDDKGVTTNDITIDISGNCADTSENDSE